MINNIIEEDKDSYLVNLFNEFDVHATGYLEQDQLKQTVSKITGRDFTDEELSTLINKFDTDKDGRISLKEFIDGCNSNTIVDEDDIQSFITTTSNNNSSFKSNISIISNSNGNNSGYSNGNNNSGYINSNSNNNNNNKHENETMIDEIDQEKHLKFIFSLFDKDGDGLVSIEQLRNMLEDIKVKSTQEGESPEEFDNDDDDIEYIINTLSADGSKTISFENFMKAIEQINSPTVNTGSPMHQDTTILNVDPHSDSELEEADITGGANSASNGNSRPDSPIVTSPDGKGKATRGNRGRTSSWVAPVAIVNMIKRRTDLYSRDQIQVFDSNDNLADVYKKEAALLRTEKEHLGSKLHLFEGQLKEARESQEKLSEDNAQLKESIVIGKKTLIENQKLTNHNKKLQEYIEDLKQQLISTEDQKTELVKNQNRIKIDKEQMYQELQSREKDLKEKEQLLIQLQQQAQAQASDLESNGKNNNNNNNNGNGESNVDQLQIENNDLKTTLIAENEKAQDTIKLLTEELKKLQKKSKGDRELLESHNQLIHKLKTNLEEAQSNSTSTSDPNLKLSLLSELEHQVVARLGSTPVSSNLDYLMSGSVNGDSPFKQREINTSTTTTTNVVTETSNNNSIPIKIKKRNGQNGGGLLIESEDEDILNQSTSTDDESDDNNGNAKSIEIKSLKSTLEQELINKKQLMELVQQAKQDNSRLESMVESFKSLNQELTDKHTEQSTSLSNMVQELQDQKKQLNEQVIILQSSNQINNQELIKTIEILNQSVSEKQSILDSTIQDLNKQQEQFKSDKQQFQSNIDQLQSTIDQLQKQHIQLQQQIDSTPTPVVAITPDGNNDKEEEINQLKNQIESIQDENEKLTLKISDLEFENQKMISQQQVLAKSIETPSNLSDAINIKAGQTQNELSLLKQRLDDLSLKNNNLLSENTQLKNSLTPTDSPSSSSRDIPSKLNNDEINYNLIKSTSASSIENLQSEISSLNSLNQQLQKDLKSYESKSSANTLLLQQHSSSNQLIDDLKKENEKSNDKYRQLEYENLMIKEDQKDLSNKNQILQDRIDSMKVEFENNLNQIQINEKLLKENEDLKLKLKKYESENDGHHQIEMEDEAKSLRSRVEDLQNKLQNERNLTKHLQSQLNSVNNNDSDQVPLISGGKVQKNRGCCTIL